MISSMTGFGRGEAEKDGHRATVELSSINSRYLDLQLRLPRELNGFEPRFKELLSESFSRGKVTCVLAWEPASGTGMQVKLNEPVARMYLDAFMQLKGLLGLPGELTAKDLVVLPDIFTVSTEALNSELASEVAELALRQAMSALDAMRRSEGEKIRCDLADRLTAISGALERIAVAAHGNVEIYRQRLHARIRELFGENGYDPQRLAEEVAYMAERSDITEECVRLRIHVDHFRDSLMGSGPAGRRLNFLVQELNREANTIGSKTQSADITSLVVVVKEELEKIREQIQNVE